jgi:two-component system, chemotaxis family, protein-glutamate methylesterase/glutaminase
MKLEVIAIGASLGGLDAVPKILARIPRAIPVPVVVVQHRAQSPDPRLAEILAVRTGLKVIEADDQSELRPGTVYVAPPNYHLLVDDGMFELSIDAPVLFARPSIDVLFESIAHSTAKHAAGVLLTGSSDDGARGIAALQKRGFMTVVQDPEEAESPIAPRAALARCKPSYVLSLSGIAALLEEVCSRA